MCPLLLDFFFFQFPPPIAFQRSSSLVGDVPPSGFFFLFRDFLSRRQISLLESFSELPGAFARSGGTPLVLILFPVEAHFCSARSSRLLPTLCPCPLLLIGTLPVWFFVIPTITEFLENFFFFFDSGSSRVFRADTSIGPLFFSPR